ncbi:efflux RND transporter permease subunit [bacterium]|nr:efflux RND transporter permease subunit [bacterium]
MKLSRFSIDRPIFTIMITLIIILLGAVALSRIPIDLMPDITYPTLSISTSYENASPEEIEELITRPIEEAMSAVPGVEEVTSSSSEGSSNVRVTFTWGTDLDVAANDIRDRLDRVIPRLPDEAERPSLRKFDLAGFPVLILGASSNLDPIQMRKIIDNQVKYRIERIPGVASLDIFGGLNREIHVNLNLDRIKSMGLSLDQILDRIRVENINVPAGILERGNLQVLVRTPGEFTSLDELRDTVISVREGAVVKLRDLAEVDDSWEKVTRIVRINGIPGINLGIFKQSGKNTVSVAKAVLKELEKINQEIPQINITPIIDTSEYIRRSVKNVGFAAIYGGLLAILVLLFFLGNIRSTAVIGAAIPVSIIATFALIYFGGFTLNLMTLGGLALGVGMLVDNAIVVLENIYRLRETGAPLYNASVEGSEEVTAAIIASTLTTLVVFLPTIFMRGMSGVMYKQMAYVVGFSLLCSLAVALTIVPMLSARMLHLENSAVSERKSYITRLLGIGKRLIHGIETEYRRILKFSLNHKKTIVAATLFLLIGSLALIPLIGVEFMPSADEGEVRIDGEMEIGSRLEVLDEKFKKIEEIVREAVPEAKNISTRIGGGWRSGGSHTGEIRVILKSQAERLRSSEDIAADLRKELKGIPGMKIRTREGQGLFILRMGTSEGEKVQIEIRGHDLIVAQTLAQRIADLVEKVEGITDVRISLEAGVPEEMIIVDRQKAADMHLSLSQIANTLQTILTGTQAGNFREGGEEYPIRVKIKDAERIEYKELLDVTLINSRGQPVVLRNVVHLQPEKGPVRIERKNQERTVTVSANISGRDTGSILSETRQKLQSIPVPKDFSISFGGDYEEQQKSFRELLLSLLLAILLVYMVMACQFESLRDPFVVMFSVPIAIIGVILILFITNTTFNVQAFIGCVMLGGIVVNNAILLVDHTNLLRRRDKMPLREAIENACNHRLRPVLMTAMTTILGLVPLAVGIGEGGETQAPLARTVIGGLTSATLITLVLIPVVYSIFEQWRSKEN